MIIPISGSRWKGTSLQEKWSAWHRHSGLARQGRGLAALAWPAGGAGSESSSNAAWHQRRHIACPLTTIKFMWLG